MKRYVDKSFDSHLFYEKLEVKCSCDGLGIVKREDAFFSFQCTSCGRRQQKERTYYRYQINEMCDNCNRHFRLDIDDESQQHFKVLNVTCSYCNHLKQGTMQKINLKYQLEYSEIKNGIEPYFGFPLYYQTSFDGKVIWAYNRNHLVYLIEYIDADIRETIRVCQSGKASYFLPKFMTLAKNRNQIVKLLKRLLSEQENGLEIVGIK